MLFRNIIPSVCIVFYNRKIQREKNTCFSNTSNVTTMTTDGCVSEIILLPTSPTDELHQITSTSPQLERSFRRCLFGRGNQGDSPYSQHDSDVMISPSLSRSMDNDFPIRRTKSDNVISPRVRKSDDDSFTINKRVLVETQRPRSSPGDSSPSAHDDASPFEMFSFKVKREKVFPKTASPGSPASSQRMYSIFFCLRISFFEQLGGLDCPHVFQPFLTALSSSFALSSIGPKRFT